MDYTKPVCWSETEDNFLRGHYTTMLLRDIGNHLGRTYSAVKNRMHKLRLKTTPDIVSSKLTSFKNETFFDTWSGNMAYVLGLLAADGNIRSPSLVQIGLHDKDSDIIIKLNALLGGTVGFYKGGTGRSNMVHWMFRSRRVYRRLLELGLCDRKTHVLEWLNPPDEFFWDFLRGYSDGDGCFTWTSVQKGKYRYPMWNAAGTKDFLTKMSKELSKWLGHEYAVFKVRRRTYGFYLRGSSAVRLGEFMYHHGVKPQLCLDRKWEKWNGF